MDNLVDDSSIHTSKAILATGGYDHTIKLWQAHTGVCYWTGQHADSQVNALCITPDKQRLASAGYQHIRLYDLSSSSPNPIVNFEGVSKNVTSVGFQEDGKWMYTTGEDGRARIWDLRGKNVPCPRSYEIAAIINHAVLHPNQTELVLCDDNGMIHVWDLRNNTIEGLIPESEATIQCVSIDPRGMYLAAVNNQGRCHVWSLSRDSANSGLQLSPKNEILAHTKQALKCKFSPDSTLLVTTSADQTASLWRTNDFSLYLKLKVSGGQKWVWDAAFTNDSQYLITASSDSFARLWCLESGEVEREYSGHQKAVTALAFSDNVTSSL